MNWDAAIEKRYAILTPLLDERSRRLLVAAESQVIGRSGTAVVSKMTGCLAGLFVRAWPN